MGLIRRITARNKGMTEFERLRLIHAFVISRITYSLPYLNPTKTELHKVNCLIRKIYKTALLIPQSTSTAKLERLGMYNTAEELMEAHSVIQLSRLSTTPAGRSILDSLGLHAPTFTDERVRIPPDLHNLLLVRPIPRNMHPEHNAKRREHRACVLARKYPMGPTTAYVDAASYRHQNAYADTELFNPKVPRYQTLTILTRSPATAKEAAIALALTHRPTPTIVISDSKTAI